MKYWVIIIMMVLGVGCPALTLQAEPASKTQNPILNIYTNTQYTTIQAAIEDAKVGNEILIPPGEYMESLLLTEKYLILRSGDPNDPNRPISAEKTIIQGDPNGPVIMMNESAAHLIGLTVQNGQIGVQCRGGQPVLKDCHVMYNADAGIELSYESCPILMNCIVALNEGPGIHNLLDGRIGGRGGLKCAPEISNCTIVQNGGAGLIGAVTVDHSIIYFNSDDPNGPQVVSDGATIVFSDVEGGFTGTGNLDVDPLFSHLGAWIDTNEVNEPARIWQEPDYHLMSQAGRWDPQKEQWIQDTLHSPLIDAGDPEAETGAEMLAPLPNPRILNMGAYGGTSQASQTRIYVTQMWDTPTQLRTPESVLYDMQRDLLYVSNYNGNFLSKVTLNGHIEELSWVTGLSRPTGLVIYAERLYVVDRNNLTKINPDTGEILERYPIGNSSFPNDIVFDDCGVGYISDSGQGSTTAIFCFVEGRIEPWLSRTQFELPNGLCIDGDTLIAYDQRLLALRAINIVDRTVRSIATFPTAINGIGDGIKIINTETYLVTAWGGPGFLVSKSGRITPIMDTNKLPPLSGSQVNNADVEYLTESNLLLVPTYFDNRVIAYELSVP